jgi:hypothetical protein
VSRVEGLAIVIAQAPDGAWVVTVDNDLPMRFATQADAETAATIVRFAYDAGRADGSGEALDAMEDPIAALERLRKERRERKP